MRSVFVAVAVRGTPMTTDCDTGPRATYELTAPDPGVASACAAMTVAAAPALTTPAIAMRFIHASFGCGRVMSAVELGAKREQERFCIRERHAMCLPGMSLNLSCQSGFVGGVRLEPAMALKYLLHDSR
jgi:hypothetical protein